MIDQTTTSATVSQTFVPVSAAAALQANLRGQVLGPGDDEYEPCRKIWNGMIDRRPALIARCTGVADVIAAVNFARAHNLLVSVRGGGHNVAGYAVCDGGLMIDLSLLKGIHVDPRARTAARPARCDLGRARPRNPGIWVSEPRRLCLHHRDCRADAGRRLWLALTQIWLCV